MKRLLAPAVLAVSFFARPSAQKTGKGWAPAPFKEEAEAEFGVELV